MPGHIQVLNCTFADFQSVGGGSVYQVMQQQGNPGWLTDYNDWLWDMWIHYINPTAQWGGCNWFTNRLFAYPQNANSNFTGWVAQLAAMTNTTNYAYRRKRAMIIWAKRLQIHCGCI